MSKMKNGFKKIGEYENAQFYWTYNGDKKQLLSITFIVCGMFKSETEEPVNDLKRFYRRIKKSVYEMTREGYFRNEFITIQKIRDNFPTTGLCFHDSEFTLFFSMPTTKFEIEIEVDRLASKIYNDNFNKQDDYTLFKFMKDKSFKQITSQCQEVE